eukprot:g4934.t1
MAAGAAQVYEPEDYANRNSDRNAVFAPHDRIGEGKHKYVVRGLYDNGEPSVHKFLKTGATFSSECFEDDVKCAKRALPIIAAFHKYLDTETRYGRGQVSIRLNVPECWEQPDAGPLCGQKALTEPRIENFKKFNSNSGAADLQAQVAQALSHFSYHCSDGTELLCDLQGGKQRDSYVLSDVVIMSAEKKYGITDLGLAGIENFCARHQCNAFCSDKWKKWEGARTRYQPVMSTTMTLDVPSLPDVRREFKYLSPCHQIRFTQDSIKDAFRSGESLLETAIMLAKEDIQKRDIPMIQVVKYTRPGDSAPAFYSLDNRRLAVFRLLEMCGKLRAIMCELVPFERREAEFHRKLNQDSDGEKIKVRGTGDVIGKRDKDTTFSMAEIRRCEVNTKMSDQECGIFLATIVDDGR